MIVYSLGAKGFPEQPWVSEIPGHQRYLLTWRPASQQIQVTLWLFQAGWFWDGKTFDDVESKIASEFKKRSAAVDGAYMAAEWDPIWHLLFATPQGAAHFIGPIVNGHLPLTCDPAMRQHTPVIVVQWIISAPLQCFPIHPKNCHFAACDPTVAIFSTKANNQSHRLQAFEDIDA
jgi:hypothetical protein